jgi:hypothetical protein
MTAIRIVCTFDAASTAEALMRLLTAEQHDVRISKGRQSLADLPAARAAKEAVVLIWSKEAPGAQYMRDWAEAIDASRLIELARAPSSPRSSRRAAVIEFTSWRGERGGKAWNALKDRLRHVASAWEPAKPAPMRTVAAIGMLSACAVTGALVVRVNDAPDVNADPTYEKTARVFETLPEDFGGMGGVIEAVEPPSVEDLDLMRLPQRFRAPTYEPLTAYVSAPLGDVPEMRDPTLLERLAALNPLARNDET